MAIISNWLSVMVVVGVVAGSVAATPPPSAPPASPSEIGAPTVERSNLGDRITDFARRAESAGFSGAILAARDGKVVAAIGVGCSDLDGTIPNTPETLFEIASATKQFTAAAILRLCQEGRLTLDDPIDRYLPSVPEHSRAITVRHLLQHTSGIPGSNSSGGGEDPEAATLAFLRTGPKHSPGTHWEYWNQGYALLSEIVARAAQRPYVSYCRDALFTPAKLTSTYFTGDSAPPGTAVAIGLSERGPARSALEHPYGSYGFQYRGMGGVVTSVWDLWRWDRALAGESVLDGPRKAELFKPGLNDYALGWFVRKSASGRLTQSHGGGVRGFASEIRRYPERDGCLIVLCNRDDMNPGMLAGALEALLFEEAPTAEPPPQPLAASLAGALEGEYVDDRGTSLVIGRDRSVTSARVHWSPPRGPVTRATLGQSDDGAVVLYEWRSATPLRIERTGEGAASSVTLLDRKFVRVQTQKPLETGAGGAKR